MLVIEGRSLGSSRPLFEDWEAPPPPDESGESGLTLRELISHVVRQEVKAFLERQEARRLDRVMTARQIEDGVARGKISPEGRGVVQRVDEGEAVAAAIQAFEDGLYLVLIDGAEQRELDAEVFVNEASRMTFVRLVFLAGG